MKPEKEEIEILLEREKKRKERVKRQNTSYLASKDRISFDVPKGKKEEIQAYCKERDTSVNTFVSACIMDIVAGKKKLVDVPEKKTRKQ